MKTLCLISGCILSILSSAQIHSYPINAQISGVGVLYVDLDSNSQDDFYFDIIELNPGIFAARVTNVGLSSYLDNSTFHYPDALDFGDSVIGYFNTGNAVLGTFTGAGQFSGAGDRYLGIRINDGTFNYDGWILLNCNSSNDTLKIISCGYHTNPGDTILAGQTFVNAIHDIESSDFKVYPNPVTDELKIFSNSSLKLESYSVFSMEGKLIKSGAWSNTISCIDLTEGVYLLQQSGDERNIFSKIIISR